jgi:hypothetical protein
MILDTPTQIKTGSWTFRYFCPKAFKIKTAAAKTKTAAKAKFNEFKILQGQTPESPTASLTPLGVILEMHEEDRQNDIKNGKLRQATFDGYMQHVSRLKPLGAEEIKECGDKITFRYYKKDIGKLYDDFFQDKFNLAAIVLREGKVIYERYNQEKEITADIGLGGMSIAKSGAASVIGHLLFEKKIKSFAPAWDVAKKNINKSNRIVWASLAAC